jgi:hypothetical protein
MLVAVLVEVRHHRRRVLRGHLAEAAEFFQSGLDLLRV